MNHSPEIRHIHLPETTSTNSYARQLELGEEILLITTDHQTAGRGQRGNTWESAPGKNLLFSLAFTPHQLPASQQFVLCEYISVVLCEVLSRYTDNIRIKWPNDIYYRDHKLCGILIEHDLEGMYLSRTIIGVGLNVNQSQFISDAPNPISLSQILGHEVDRAELLSAICHQFANPSLLHLTSPEALHARYTALLYRLGVSAPYRDTKGCFTATLHHVEPDGRLILEDERGEQRSYLFKEVAYVLTPHPHQPGEALC